MSEPVPTTGGFTHALFEGMSSLPPPNLDDVPSYQSKKVKVKVRMAGAKVGLSEATTA